MTVGIVTGAARGMGAACAAAPGRHGRRPRAGRSGRGAVGHAGGHVGGRRPSRPAGALRPRREGSQAGSPASPPGWRNSARCVPWPTPPACRRPWRTGGRSSPSIWSARRGSSRPAGRWRCRRRRSSASRPWRRCSPSTRATFPPTPSSTIRWPTDSSRRSVRRSVLRSRTPGWPTRGASVACTASCGARPCASARSARASARSRRA